MYLLIFLNQVGSYGWASYLPSRAQVYQDKESAQRAIMNHDCDVYTYKWDGVKTSDVEKDFWE